jgi:Domain of unknown function (DUF4267)
MSMRDAKAASRKLRRAERWVLTLGLVGGALLTAIGIRYFITPEGAARTFGVTARPAGYEFHYIIGLRNVWLGLLAVALAALREWRVLALWFGLGAFVCFADAAIAASATGRLPQIAFHVGCGFACVGLAAGSWSLATKKKPAN